MNNFKSNGPEAISWMMEGDGQSSWTPLSRSSHPASTPWRGTSFFSNTQRGTPLLCPSKSGTMETKYMVANHVHMSLATLTTRGNSS